MGKFSRRQINDIFVIFPRSAPIYNFNIFFSIKHAISKFSRPQIDYIFLLFPEKQELTFCAKETICMNCQILFSGKN